MRKKVSTITGVIILVIFAVAAASVLSWFLASHKVPVYVAPVVSQTQPTVNQTTEWKTYTNEKYGFSFAYPANILNESFGESSVQCSKDGLEKYASRMIFELDQSVLGPQSETIQGRIICTSLNESKIDDFVNDINSTHTEITNTTIGGKMAYETDLYGAFGESGGTAIFIGLGNNTLVITYQLGNDTNRILSTFKFTK